MKENASAGWDNIAMKHCNLCCYDLQACYYTMDLCSKQIIDEGKLLHELKLLSMFILRAGVVSSCMPQSLGS